MSALLFVCCLTGIIHFTEAVSSSLRIAGVRTRQIATSLSFVNVSLLVTRTSNMLQAPILGGMVDTAILRGRVDQLGMSFRMILLGAVVGNVLGALAVPTFVELFKGAILEFEKVGSVPLVIFKALRPSGIVGIFRSIRMPRFSMLKKIHWNRLPKTFLVLNVVMVGIYAVGVLSSLYAGAQIPEYRATAIQLSAIVNGMATILLAIMVDPSCARITDHVITGQRPEEDVSSMVFFLITGRIVATLILAQLIFFPATEYIKGATHLLRALFSGGAG